MVIIFLIVCTLMVLFDFYVHRRMINVVSVMTLPYMIIIPINNYFAVRYGFNRILDQTIGMIMGGLICVFLGSLAVNFNRRVSKTNIIYDYKQDGEKFGFYNMVKMKRYVIFVELIMAIRLLIIVRNFGFGYLSDDYAESNFISGIPGHLYLTIYPLIPIVFYYWLKNKKNISYLLISIVGMIFAFLSFTKYHSIGLIILIYLFVALEDHRYLKKGAIALVITAIAIFMINYLLGFLAKNLLNEVSSDFYMLHLWKYIGGSCIHDNTIFIKGQNIGIGYLFKILYCTIPLLNMIFSGIFGAGIQMPFNISYDLVGINGERSNVLDFIGFIYPSKGGVLDILIFAFIMFSIGGIFTYIYNQSLRKTDRFAITICVFMTFFCFLSFFGVFASKSMTWEVVVWSSIFPVLFDKRVVIRIGNRRI